MSNVRVSETHPNRATYSERRARPRLTEQIQIIRELWLLREQTRVQAAERCFLAELERLLTGRPYSQVDHATRQPPPPPEIFRRPFIPTSPIPSAPPPPPLPTHAPPSPTSTVSFLDDGAVFESHPPPRGDHSPARERPGSLFQSMEQARASQRVTVSIQPSISSIFIFIQMRLLVSNRLD